MKGLYKDKSMCLKTLSNAVSLLEDCRSDEIIIKGELLDYILVALAQISIVLNHNPQIEYPSRDVLQNEYDCFKRKEVAYIDGHCGHMKTVKFKDILSQSCNSPAYAMWSNWKTLGIIPASPYKIGNEAIGQIFYGDDIIYEKQIAIQHSLHCTAKRWYNESLELMRMIEEEKWDY